MASYADVLSLLDCDGAWPNLSKFIAYECKASSSKFVEFWVPVQISNLQLEQYCSMILSNAMALSSCSKSDTFGALHDILVSNRKVCSLSILTSVEFCDIYAVDAKCPQFSYRCLEAHQYCSYN